MDQIAVSLYELASNVATPLAIAATTVLLFFLFLRFVVSRLEEPIKKITGAQAFVLLLAAISYGTIITAIALVGGLGLYGYQYYYEEFVEKERLIDQGDEALENQEVDTATRIGKQLSERWNDDPQGLRILGAANFMGGDFQSAAKNFDESVELMDDLDVCDIQKRNVIASSVAAHASAGSFENAIERMSTIEGCDLEKGMHFNHAKLLIFTGSPEAALKILQDDKLTSDSRPDYRDRVAFETAIAHLAASGENWEDEATTQFLRAMCLNAGFKQLLESTVLAGAVDPPGNLIQVYEMELELASRQEFEAFFETLENVADREVGCE